MKGWCCATCFNCTQGCGKQEQQQQVGLPLPHTYYLSVSPSLCLSVSLSLRLSVSLSLCLCRSVALLLCCSVLL